MKLKLVKVGVFILLFFCSSAYSDNKENNKNTSKLETDYLEYDDPEIPQNETAQGSKSKYT